MKYIYQGYDVTAQDVEGVVEATNMEDAKRRLRELSIAAVSIIPEEGELTEAQSSGKLPEKTGLAKVFGSSGKPKLKDFTVFIRQMATMQSAGIPIVEGLGILAEQTNDKNFAIILVNIQKNIEEGVSLTDALRLHPKVFDNIFINLVGAGEMSGSLEATLGRLAEYYEKAAALRRKIISASTYPVLVIVLVLGIVAALMIFVTPMFEKMFKEMGKDLPGPTQTIIDISRFIRGNILIFVGAVVMVLVGVVMAFKNETVKRFLDPIYLKIPVFGDLLLKTAVARFTRTLGTLIQSGVSIVEGLDVTAKVAGNSVIEAAIVSTQDSIKEGSSVAGPLGESKVFPKMVISMIDIGEKTGSLETMLGKIAEFYEDEVDEAVSTLTSVLEPMMIVIVGVIVASILIPLYLPVFQLGDLVG